ncbi:unnamed protein product, partial [Darwinula stevensoni]
MNGRCPEICTADYNPVCGSDGVTYANNCNFQAENCKRGNRLVVRHEGPCRNGEGPSPPGNGNNGPPGS